MSRERGVKGWQLAILRAACVLLPREIRADQFNEWRDELQCAEENRLSSGRRAFSIVFRSVPQMAWRARRADGVGSSGLETVGPAARALQRERNSRGMSRLFFFLVGPLSLLALGAVTFTFDLNDSSVYYTNEELTHAVSPTWLYGLLRAVGVFALLALLILTSRKIQGGSASGSSTTRARTIGALVLLLTLVAKMIVFSQYSVLFFLAIGACALFLVLSSKDQNQHRPSLASQN